MEDKNKSKYKDTGEVKKLLSSYQKYGQLFSIGIALICLSYLPKIFMSDADLNSRLVVIISLILLGVVLMIFGKVKIDKIKSENTTDITSMAENYVAEESKRVKKILNRNMIIGLLLLIIGLVLVYMTYKEVWNPDLAIVFSTIQVLLLAIGIFMIVSNKIKKSSYKYLLKKSDD